MPNDQVKFMKTILKTLSLLLLAAALAACAPSTALTRTQIPTLQNQVQNQPAPVLTAEQPSEGLYVDLYERANRGVVAILVYSESIAIGQGSGFLFDNEGHILTNYHVVESAEKIEVAFSSGFRAQGEVIGTDPDSDIAVVRVQAPPEELFPLPLGSSKKIKVGQTVVAIGNPYGLSGTMTVGIISARGRMLESMRTAPSGGYFTAADLIQTDAAINPGNSGGPLLNLAGEVIGITRAIRTDGGDGVGTLTNSGIGFAVPIDVIKRVTPYLIQDGKYDYPYLGIVSREELTLLERQALNLPSDAQGAYVISVAQGGPAARAGLRGGNIQSDIPGLLSGGDLIVAVDDQPVRNFSDLLSYLVTYKSPGDALNLTILRDQQKMTLPVVLVRRPD